ncbi:hypothetical protein AB0L44_06255 [Nonomuraea wenchangensis]|uniref:hypothetical protein n=1 Tax=Nonomuraea wenchangensis TaxID=568860 RepID=UPI00343E16DE
MSELSSRYRRRGEVAFKPRSRRPKSSPNAIDADADELIFELRKDLAEQGLDAEPDTIVWHLPQPGHRLGTPARWSNIASATDHYRSRPADGLRPLGFTLLCG